MRKLGTACAELIELRRDLMNDMLNPYIRNNVDYPVQADISDMYLSLARPVHENTLILVRALRKSIK